MRIGGKSEWRTCKVQKKRCKTFLMMMMMTMMKALSTLTTAIQHIEGLTFDKGGDVPFTPIC